MNIISWSRRRWDDTHIYSVSRCQCYRGRHVWVNDASTRGMMALMALAIALTICRISLFREEIPLSETFSRPRSTNHLSSWVSHGYTKKPKFHNLQKAAWSPAPYSHYSRYCRCICFPLINHAPLISAFTDPLCSSEAKLEVASHTKLKYSNETWTGYFSCFHSHKMSYFYSLYSRSALQRP